MKKKRKRLLRGRDWDGWCWKDASAETIDTWYVLAKKPNTWRHNGEWVRVKIVEVKP
jgi:hypothetical protein